MRKEKILEILENAKDGNGAVPMRLVRTAFDKLPEPCEDMISRQAAIDAVNNAFDRETLLTVFVRSIAVRAIRDMPSAQPEQQWIPVSERLPSEEERKEWIDNNLDGIGYLYPCLVTRYSSINPDRTKNNPYVAKHYFDGEDFLNAGEEVCSEYIIAWMPLPEAYKTNK